MLNLNGVASIQTGLSLLNEPPFNLLRNSTLPVDFARGTSAFSAEVGFEMRKGLRPDDIAYSASADLTG